MKREDIQLLLKRYTEGKCTPKEMELLDAWADHQAATENWLWLDESHKNSTQEKIRKKIYLSSPKRSYAKLWLSGIAAALFLVCSIGIYLQYLDKDSRMEVALKHTREVVSPGTNAAMLTLGDGTVLSLDSAAHGFLAAENDVLIRKGGHGELLYSHDKKTNASTISLNTLSVPRGGNYQLQLEDGTKVWLNSASSITYPSTFSENSRSVTLKGEAYFEVAVNKNKPFMVSANDVEIIVTGTHFNVCAYDDDETLKTTLLEGGVYVKKDGRKIILQPGEQAISRKSSGELIHAVVDPSNAVAWKSGNFVFEDQDLRSIMRNLSRWYDVEIAFEGKIPYDKKVGGTFSKAKGVVSLLDNLQKLIGIKYKIEGRRITVSS